MRTISLSDNAAFERELRSFENRSDDDERPEWDDYGDAERWDA
jgi:hypothetical protein